MIHLIFSLAISTAGIDDFIRKAMAEIGTPPGLAVVAVSRDQVLYEGHFGLRDVEAKLPVTRDTRFYIGSSTKAFTAMAAAVLVTEGAINIDEPVTKWWPELKLGPSLDPSRISLRDVLAMRPGFDNSTYNFRSRVIANLDDEEELLRVLETYSSPRPRTFDYSNMAYEFAAEVLRRATKKSWKQLTEEKVFRPLRMTDSISDVPPEGVPVALLYHTPSAGRFVRNPGKTPSGIGPAGGTYTTTADAGRWLQAMLNEGRAGGKQVLPRRAVQLVTSEQTMQAGRWRWFERWGWGLGQDLGRYEGHTLIHRFGGFNGAYSHMSYMPDRGFGVAVFSNGGSAAADAVAAYLYDVLLGRDDVAAKWRAELSRLAADAEKARAERFAREEPMRNPARPARPLPHYTGTYRYHRLGALAVRMERGRLRAALGVLDVELVPAGGDDFYADWRGEGEPERVRFTFTPSGHPARFEWGDRIFEALPKRSAPQ